MAVKAKKGTISITTTAGADQAVDLTGDGFSASEPLRAIIFWCVTRNADALAGANFVYSIGFASNNGGSIQQGYATGFSLDGAGTSDNSRGANTTACLKTFLSGVPAVDMELDVVTFTDTGFTIDQFAAPAAAQRIHYLALGGSHITAARVFTFGQVVAASQDITINAGFGQPDLVFMTSHYNTTLGDSTTNSGAGLHVFNRALEQRTESFRHIDNATAMDLHIFHDDKAISSWTGGALDSIGTISATANWPTDGFQLDYSDQPSLTEHFIGLALKGTADFKSKITKDTVPIAGAPPVVRTHDLGASTTPKAGIVFGLPEVASAIQIGTAGTDQANLGGFGMGASDGTSEGFCWAGDDDQANASAAGQSDTTAKVYQDITGAATPVLRGEADGVFSGTQFQTSWSDIGTIASEYSIVVIGETAAAATTSFPTRRNPNRGLTWR